jgi:hypothetical protein
LPYYVNVLEQYRQRLGWQYGQHIFPHDARVKEFGSGRTRVEELIKHGIRPVLCPMHGLEDGINAVRATLPHCWFAEDECSNGIRHLKAYRKHWDDARGCWKDKPRHDSSSHCADSLRYLSMAWREVSADPVAEPTPAEIIKKIISKKRTIADQWAEYVDERRERDEELPEDFDEFALSNKTKLEFK